MGHFLLTNLLLRENLLADRSRIVCLSSHAHYSSKINFEDLNWTKKYSGYYAYAQSKLANILFARELDRRLKEQGKNITAVSCHPGMGKWISISHGRLNNVGSQFFSHQPDPLVFAVLTNFLRNFSHYGDGPSHSLVLHCAAFPIHVPDQQDSTTRRTNDDVLRTRT